MENNIVIDKEKDKKQSEKPNLAIKILLTIFGFGTIICATYLLCLIIVAVLITAVIFTIIYGVCHSVLEIARMIAGRKTKADDVSKKQSLID